MFKPQKVISDEDLDRLKSFLDPVAEAVEAPEYIASDPVAFMHRYDDTEDQNLAGFLSALLAWGRRDIVMAKIEDLLSRFETGPADFIGNFSARDEARLVGFRHRTFTSDDIYWILEALYRVLQKSGSFEAFWADCYRLASANGTTTRPLLSVFYDRFFEHIPEAPVRVRKHISSPDKNSSCKRLYLYLRWVIRRDSCVDPGTMAFMPPSELVIPMDVHVARYARMFGLLSRTANDWKSVMQLTEMLRKMDPVDPVRYDYALFGLGVNHIPIPEALVVNRSENVPF